MQTLKSCLKLGAGALGLMALAAMLVGFQPRPAAAQDVKIDGSSTVFPISEAMAEEFQNETGFTVTVGVSGSGGGFKKFCPGNTDVSNASRPISASEREICAENGVEFVELPVGIDALTVVINPENNWSRIMTVSQLKTIWEPEAQGQITRWNQVNPAWPDRPLALYGAGADSGTYDYFTEAIVGESGASRGDFTASEDDNVLVQGVANDPNALGFFGFAYYIENTDLLSAVAIDNEEGGPPVIPAFQTAASGTYQPLSRPMFMYVNTASADKEAVQAYVEFFMSPENSYLVREVGYVPLPDEAYQLALENFRNRTTGSAFADGAQVGVSIADLLRSVRSR